MKYSIRPYIHNEEERYVTLFTEIHKFSKEELDQIIQDMENVLKGTYNSSSFSGEVVTSVEFNKDKSIIKHFDERIGEEPTMDIYHMLKEYRKKMDE